MNESNLVEFSSELLQKVKSKIDVTEERAFLKTISTEKLCNELTEDVKKKTFWINLYNAFIQMDGFELKGNKNKFFGKKRIKLKDAELSFDDVEHIILRKNKWKYSLGYFASFYVTSKLRRLMVNELDNRIHFALNCGAVSCPAIFSYSEKDLDNQLELATESFLEQCTLVNQKDKRVSVSRIFFFYLGDFNGFKGIKRLLHDRGFIGHLAYKIKFSDYDWTTKLNNFAKVDVDQ